MKDKNDLIAYVKVPEGGIYIDFVRVSKKGTSYHYRGQVLNRSVNQLTDACLNDSGEVYLISPFRRYNRVGPSWLASQDIEVSDIALSFYEEWISKYGKEENINIINL